LLSVGTFAGTDPVTPSSATCNDDFIGDRSSGQQRAMVLDGCTVIANEADNKRKSNAAE
jgi:hypothetical protein